jgi:hypothetical protein
MAASAANQQQKLFFKLKMSVRPGSGGLARRTSASNDRPIGGHRSRRCHWPPKYDKKMAIL